MYKKRKKKKTVFKMPSINKSNKKKNGWLTELEMSLLNKELSNRNNKIKVVNTYKTY